MSRTAVLRRLAQAALVIAIAFTGAFLLLQALPGDAVMIKFENPELGLSPQQIEDIRQSYGADVPLWQQFAHTASGFLQGDLGYSIQGTPVRQLIAEALPSTLALAAAAFVVAVLLAFSVAVLAMRSRFGWLRGFFSSLPSLFVSVPVFWLGMVLIQVVSFQLGWVRVVQPGPIEGLILPVLTLAVPISAPIAQVLIRSAEDIERQPFVAVVRSKGASEGWVLWRNIARNALLPTLTIAGILLGELIAGAVVTETVFGRAGIGRLTEQAVANQDVAVLQAIVVLAAVVFVLANLLVDLVAPLIDPRLKDRRRARTTDAREPIGATA
ncbi:ABC transporter permease [Blastococcus sp. Marseille-P5729]|uniref:ABC transporter permease n=1 Tax=Blastococcus sp. Marseille-P5729 TaxID=2086582 RepID=UPI000D0EB9A9|nr:ABC transporter permease [Blastococcus sp. Marseille-P5729]